MQEIDDSDSGEETEQLGNHYVTQLDNSSERNSRAVSYLFEMKQENRRKSQAKEMMSEELKRSHEKLKRSGVRKRNRFSLLSEAEPREHVYHRMDASVRSGIICRR